jgi:hypothetical protein
VIPANRKVPAAPIPNYAIVAAADNLARAARANARGDRAGTVAHLLLAEASVTEAFNVIHRLFPEET